MCGIFGYIGAKNAGNVILEGLRRLEYRGYDSWGITVVSKSLLKTQKNIGKIGNTTLKLPKSTMGIGHTRWATHGGVTVSNAHPHLDCPKKLSVVHNGIVENYIELKKMLQGKGHVFTSETDTEVIVHLIEEHLKKNSFKDSVRLSFKVLHGLSAIVVLDLQSGTIIAAKNGSPLILGIGKNEYFLASDLSGILPHTKRVIFLKDHEMVVIKNGFSLYSLPQGKKVIPQVEHIAWKQEEANLGKFKHFMLKEIAEQPKVITSALHEEKLELKKLKKSLSSFSQIFAVAAGTAYHASVAGAYLLSKQGIQIKPIVASEFELVMPFVDKKTLILVFSQSGETIDVIEPVSKAQKKGATVASFVNVLGSTIFRMSDVKILLNAGPEKAVASTKAYIAKLAMLLLLCMGDSAKPLLEDTVQEIRQMLEAEWLITIKKLAKKLSKSENIYLIGRGISYQSALEGALKIKEVSYIPTEGLPGGELKHGTLALIEKGVPVIVFAPLDESHASIISNAIEIKSRGGVIIGISPEKSDVFDVWIPIKDLREATIITQIVPIQLLAYFLALEKGIKDPDKPRNLAKSVTVK